MTLGQPFNRLAGEEVRTTPYAESAYALGKIYRTIMQSANQHSVTQMCCNNVLFMLFLVEYLWGN
jgi:hypothetical protein